MGLIQFLEEHGESVEADFQRYYGIYLGDLFTGKLTYRRLLSLLSQLPDSSQTALGVKGYFWTTDNELQAAIVDLLQAANYQRGQGKGRKPEPIKRPWDQPVTPEVALERKQNKPDVLSREEFEKHMFDDDG